MISRKKLFLMASPLLITFTLFSSIIFPGQNLVHGQFNSQSSSTLEGQTILALVVEEGDPKNLYCGTETGMFKSTDQGASWHPVMDSLSPLKVRALALNESAQPNILYAGTDQGIFRTFDGGLNWMETGTEITGSEVRALALDPQNPGVLYAALDRGLIRSVDGGENWEAAPIGLDHHAVHAFAVDPSDSRVFYAAVEGSILKSTDGGNGWRELPHGDAWDVRGLAVDPFHPNIIYAADMKRGLFQSTDGGETWAAINSGLNHRPVWCLAVEPSHSTILYAATEAGLFKSINGGEQWVATGQGSAASSSPRFSGIAGGMGEAETLSAPGFVFAINCGGPAYTSRDGFYYRTDTNFYGGSLYKTNLAIQGTDDDVLYQSERFGNFRYDMPVSNGTYQVALKFAEIYNTSAGQRIFNVKIEGQPLITNLDIYAKVGRFTAYDRTFSVTVTDGVLNIEFITVKGNAKVNAIVVTAGEMIPQYTITAAAGSGGKITPSGEVKVNQGATSLFTVSPNQDFKIADVKVDGISQGAIDRYTFSNVTANHAIEAIFVVVPSTGGTASFQQGINGYAGNKNAVLDLWHPDTALGTPLGAFYLRPGVVNALMRFDLSSLPTQAYVKSAKLRFYVLGRTNSSSMTALFFPMLRPWAAGQSTWHQPATGQEWGKVGCNDIYMDRLGTPIASVAMPALPAFYEVDLTPLVRRWVHYPENNYGLYLAGDASASVQYQIAGDNYMQADKRPKLIITYGLSDDNDFGPWIKLTSPTHGSFVRDIITLSADVRDDKGISRVEYLLDGAIIATATTPPYQTTWNFASASRGQHNFRARVYDTQGQMAEEAILIYVYRMEGNILTIVHISDAHLGTPWQGDPPNPALYTQRFQQAIQEIQHIIQPDVVINTGDSTNVADTYSCQLYSNLTSATKIPVKAVPGNHDLANNENYLYHFGPFKLWFDVGPHRFVGFTVRKFNEAWLSDLLSGTDKTGIFFGHYLIRQPQGATTSPTFYTMPEMEKTILQRQMSQHGARAYLSGHYHQYFLLEDHVSRAVEIGAPALGQKQSYVIVTSDNGIISSNLHYLGDWPAIVITSPQRWYSDGGSWTIQGTVPLRAKIFGDASITSVLYGIDSTPSLPMKSLGHNIWEAPWDTSKMSPGVHRIYVTAADSRGRSRQAMIDVRISSP